MKQLLKKFIPQSIIDHYRRTQVKKRFTEIYRNNEWLDRESVSGPGSSLERTAPIREKLPRMFAKYQVRTLLDIPCGDFNWFSKLDLSAIQYLGADIVTDLIRQNNRNYKNDHIDFKILNIVCDQLPAMDMIFCRDCLVHLSNRDITLTINNIIKSGSKWLATTSFIERTTNEEMHTGGWRPINLQAPPFNLPAPTEIIFEDRKVDNGTFADKAICIWQISQLEPLNQK